MNIKTETTTFVYQKEYSIYFTITSEEGVENPVKRFWLQHRGTGYGHSFMQDALNDLTRRLEEIPILQEIKTATTITNKIKQKHD